MNTKEYVGYVIRLLNNKFPKGNFKNSSFWEPYWGVEGIIEDISNNKHTSLKVFISCTPSNMVFFAADFPELHDSFPEPVSFMKDLYNILAKAGIAAGKDMAGNIEIHNATTLLYGIPYSTKQYLEYLKKKEGNKDTVPYVYKPSDKEI